MYIKCSFRKFVLVMMFAATLVGCESASQLGATEKGAIAGGALGAGLGAIVGNQVGSTGAGIAIGSAFGALGGGLIGNQIDSTDAALAERDQRLSDQERQIEENKRLIEELRRGGTDARMTSRGVSVNLPDVLFEFDSANLTSAALGTTNDIAQAIKKVSTKRRISVEGHTDSIGTAAYNLALSERRAQSVANQLSRDGIAKSRMKVRGFGAANPVASNKDARGRQQNRRVEIIVEN